MQISAANLLIASQQLARGVQQTPRDPRIQFATALAKEKDLSGIAPFAPLEFEAVAPQAPTRADEAPRRAGVASHGQLGTKLDIRV